MRRREPCSSHIIHPVPSKYTSLLCQNLLLNVHLPSPFRAFAELHAKHSATSSSSPSLCLALHLLANLDIDLEELCDAAVQAHGLAFVEVGFAVCGVDAFRCAGFEEAVAGGLASVLQIVVSATRVQRGVRVNG